ncbi:ribonuclease E inhibitor RraB [Sphingomonas naphthae]|uniref:Ribonuclease E inhibitor RraB n=1 Tax=Sphingomonas naphthae TaxID=1813468 RepID=A0ABY7TKM3_9SPHN|nr:ribonuclease E inhibitor RraB [Sphingomonas naphthae]WCT73588.1 ribonuclease E inhibitor RraB [Sphingomonas naphthae]
MARPVDPKRLAEEWAADQDVLAQMAAGGDIASIVRTIDVSFTGPEKALDRLADAAADYGFEVAEFAETAPGTWQLDCDIDQTTEPEAIKALTTKCLEIEAAFPGVAYDGWGCLAQTD